MRRPRPALPLAVRLSATTAMVVAAALLVVVGLTAQIARHHLATALDQRLRANADAFRDGPAHRVTGADTLAAESARWLAAQAFAPDEVVAVRTVTGEVHATTGGLDLRTVPRAADLLGTDRSRWWDVPGPQGTVVRALTVPLSLHGNRIGTLVAAASRAPLDATLHALLASVGWASGFGLAFATLLAFAAVRRTLGPLLRMSRQVEAVHATGDLSRRVGPPGP